MAPAGKGKYWQKRNGTLCDGDFEEDKGHGFGVLTRQSGTARAKVYAGGWLHDGRHGDAGKLQRGERTVEGRDARRRERLREAEGGGRALRRRPHKDAKRADGRGRVGKRHARDEDRRADQCRAE